MDHGIGMLEIMFMQMFELYDLHQNVLTFY